MNFQTKRNASTDETIIAAPRLEPFTLSPLCSQCGEPSVPRWQQFFRSLAGKRPLMAFRRFYCDGSKPPTQASDHPIGRMIGAEDRFTCAGINCPHLHVKCGACGYAWFSEVATKL